MSKEFRVEDRRHFLASGEPRYTPRAGDLPRVSFEEFTEPTTRATAFYRFHLRRSLVDGALRPEGFWMLVHGLLVSSYDSFVAIVTLNADKRPKRLGIQASVLVRALLEAFGNLLALAENPEKNVRLFELDNYLNQFRQQKALKRQRGDRPKWNETILRNDAALSRLAGLLGLASDEASDPEENRSIREWPSPYFLFNSRKRRGSPDEQPLLKGERAEIFADMYYLWYSQLSGFAHQRFAAAAQAWVEDDPNDIRFDQAKMASNIAIHTLLLIACILGEIAMTLEEMRVPLPVNIHVPVLWTRLLPHYTETGELLNRRYGRVLGLAT